MYSLCFIALTLNVVSTSKFGIILTSALDDNLDLKHCVIKEFEYDQEINDSTMLEPFTFIQKSMQYRGQYVDSIECLQLRIGQGMIS